MRTVLQCACGKMLDVAADQLGQEAECPWCGNRFIAAERVASTTAVQAEPPPPRSPNRTPGTNEDADALSVEKPWIVPPAIWILMFGILTCSGLCFLGFVATPLLIGGGDATQLDVAQAQVSGNLTRACEVYRRKNGKYPASLAPLLERNEVGGPYLESPDHLIDPWGQPYQYDVKGPRNNGERPDIWTVPKNGGIEIGNWPKIR